LKTEFPIWSNFENKDKYDRLTGTIKYDWLLIWGDRVKKIFEEAKKRFGMGILVCDEMLVKLNNIMQGGRQTAFQLICRLNSEQLEPMLFSDDRYNFAGCSQNYINLLGGMTYDGYPNLLLNNIQSGGSARLFFLKICDSRIDLPVTLGFKVKKFTPVLVDLNLHIVDSIVNYWIVNHITPPKHNSWQQCFFDEYFLQVDNHCDWNVRDFFLKGWYEKMSKKNHNINPIKSKINDIEEDDIDIDCSDDDVTNLPSQLPPSKKRRLMKSTVVNSGKQEISDSDDDDDKEYEFPTDTNPKPKYRRRNPYNFYWKQHVGRELLFDPKSNDNPHGRVYLFNVSHPKTQTIEDMNATKCRWENNEPENLDEEDDDDSNNAENIEENGDIDFLANVQQELDDDCNAFVEPNWVSKDAQAVFSEAVTWIKQAKVSGVFKYDGEILLNRGRQIILNMASLLQMTTNVLDKGGILGKLDHGYEAPYIYAGFRMFQILCDEISRDYRYIVETNMVQRKTIWSRKGADEERQTTVSNSQPTLQQLIQCQLIQHAKLGLRLNTSHARSVLRPSFRKHKDFSAKEMHKAFRQLVSVNLAKMLLAGMLSVLI